MTLYTFHIIGPGIDMIERLDEHDLDDFAERVALVIRKFKNDAQRRREIGLPPEIGNHAEPAKIRAEEFHEEMNAFTEREHG